MSKIADLQREYDEMVKIAMEALNSGFELDEEFEKELYRLMKVVKSLGGRV